MVASPCMSLGSSALASAIHQCDFQPNQGTKPLLSHVISRTHTMGIDAAAKCYLCHPFGRTAGNWPPGSTEGGKRYLERESGSVPQRALQRHSGHVRQWVKVVGEAEALEGDVSHHVHEHGASAVAGERVVLVHAAASLRPPSPPRMTPVVSRHSFDIFCQLAVRSVTWHLSCRQVTS